MSSTRTPILADSCSTRRMIRSRSTWVSGPPLGEATAPASAGDAMPPARISPDVPAVPLAVPGVPLESGGPPPGVAAAPLPLVLGEAPDRRQRGAELVARVRDELPHPLLRPVGGGL